MYQGYFEETVLLNLFHHVPNQVSHLCDWNFNNNVGGGGVRRKCKEKIIAKLILKLL